MSSAAVRVCNEHGAACTEDARDRVVCPGAGPVGAHVVKAGKWSVGGAGVGGDELVMAEARRHFREQKRDHTSAREALIAAARLTPRLLRALLEDAADRAIARASGVKVAVPQEEAPPRRAAAAPEPRPARSTTDGGLALMAASNLRDLLGQELAPGLPLKHAAASTVLEFADQAAGQARAGAVRARWLRLLAARMPNGRTVGQVFDEGAAQRLHRQAEADLAAVLAGLSKRLTTSRGRELEAASK